MSGLEAAGAVLLAAVVAERGAELAVSARNARRLREQGGVEHGRGHYPALVAFHAALLVACAAEPLARPAAWPLAAAAPAAAAVLATQALRWWAVASLGGRWTTRVITLPGAPPVRRGPYRWLRHPNYLAVAVEVAALPLALGAWRTAIVGSVVNAAILRTRIRVEEEALGEEWENVFRRGGRSKPGRGGSGDGTEPTGYGRQATGGQISPAGSGQRTSLGNDRSSNESTSSP